jgi:hypothetical protein
MLSSKPIENANDLNSGDVIDIFYFGNKIKESCLVLEIIQDHYFTKGLIIYLNGTLRETIDLENQDGLHVVKLIKSSI